MGRWAQARRRSGGAGGPVPSAPPPAPVAHLQFYGVRQDAQGDDDTGGRCYLWFQDPDELTWSVVDQGAWAAAKAWFLGYEGIFRTTEFGNGVRYTGMSEPSNEVHFVPPP